MAQLPLWMGEIPDYEVVNGHMQITIGEFALAMPISVFLLGCTKGREALAKWQVAQLDTTAKIIKLPSH